MTASHEIRTAAPRHALLAATAVAGVMILAAGTAQAMERTVYSGTVGSAKVVMELSSEEGERVQGRYFYPRYGVDIPLSGTPAALAEAIPLAAKDGSEDGPVFTDAATGQPDVTWAGALTGARSDRYQGQWKDARSGKSLPFDLRKVATYDPDAVAPDSESITRAIVQGASSGVAGDAEISTATAPYEFLKMQAPMTAGAEVRMGPVAYRMVVDPRTRFGFPRITRHPDPAAMARANALLEQRQWHVSLEALACKAAVYTETGSAAGSLGGFDDEVITVTYLSPTLMSVTEGGSTYCGGAHPDNHFDPFTLDLRRGEYLDFNHLLDATVPNEYGSSDPSPAMSRFIDRHAAPVQSGADPDCGGDTLKQYLSLYLEAGDKLAFAVSGIGHAMGDCLGPQIELPVRDLGRLLKPDAAQYFPDLKLRR